MYSNPATYRGLPRWVAALGCCSLGWCWATPRGGRSYSNACDSQLIIAYNKGKKTTSYLDQDASQILLHSRRQAWLLNYQLQRSMAWCSHWHRHSTFGCTEGVGGHWPVDALVIPGRSVDALLEAADNAFPSRERILV